MNPAPGRVTPGLLPVNSAASQKWGAVIFLCILTSPEIQLAFHPFHDAVYQMLRQGLLGQEWRGPADWIYEKACVADGMWRIRAWGHFRALRAFGGAAAAPGTDKPILTAP